tara:strand:+ start:526 stop:2205 length:1680 start_codon:yes stop_codon:yes gene_type:complete
MKLIKRISLKFGAGEGAESLSLTPSGITLFVGPNNSGKSLVLREIEKYCATHNKSSNHVLADIEFDIPTKEIVLRDLESKRTEPNKNENVPDGSIVVHRINTYQGLKQREVIPLSQLSGWVESGNIGALARYYISLLTVRLDGATRTTLLNPTNRGDLLASPTNILSALWIDSNSRKKIRNLTKEAFGTFFTIDALNGAQLRARLAKRAPIDDSEEQSLDQRSRDYHRDSIVITEASDGVKAFTGMVSTILGQDCKIPLIDEPEAFLHPPLAKRLGKELAETAATRDACAFIATHSADFLMGCISGSPEVNIVRLTYKGGKSTARLLKHERLQEIIKSPLMRSTGVLSALFHEGAIVCEGDSDRALYQEINDRIATVEKDNYSEALFINAHSKQSTAKIAGPLREMGIPAAVVVDFDILKKNEEFKNLLNELSIPIPISAGWCQQKAQISQYCVENNIDWKRRGILDVEDSGMNISLVTLLKSLADFGIFVVPNGELESWLTNIGVEPTNNKKYWLLSIFEVLGGDPDSDNYVNPSNNDIWEFIRNIASWINNPNRNGV